MAIHIHMLYLRSIVVLYTLVEFFPWILILSMYVHKYLQDYNMGIITKLNMK